MAVILDAVAPVRARMPPHPPALTGKSSVGGRIHLQQCRTFQRGRSRPVTSANLGSLCKVCSTPGILDAGTAARLADVLVLDAAHALDTALRRKLPGDQTYRWQFARVRELFDAAHAYSDGHHPEAAQLQQLFPDAATKPPVLAEVAAAVAAADDDSCGLLDSDALRVLSGSSADAARKVWATLRALALSDVPAEAATQLALDSVELRDEPTAAGLPDDLHTTRADHPGVAAWMRHQWEGAAVVRAQATLAAQIDGHLRGLRDRAARGPKRLVRVERRLHGPLTAAFKKYADGDRYRLFDLRFKTGLVMWADEVTFAWLTHVLGDAVSDMADDVGGELVALAAGTHDALEVAEALADGWTGGFDILETAVMLARDGATTTTVSR